MWCGYKMKLQFREITPENWRTIRLEVWNDQTQFVASYITMLARAYVYRNYNSVVFAIYRDGNPIGLLMQRDHIDGAGRMLCILAQFFIDKSYQGRGYGKAAMKSWLASVEKANRYDAVELCFISGDYAAERLYEGLGFARKLHSDEDDEIVMTYPL